MYNDFISERQRYRDELTGVITQIRSQISAAINSAAGAITDAANSAQYVPKSTDTTGSGIGSGTASTGSGGGSAQSAQKTRYKIDITYYNSYQDYVNKRNGEIHYIGGYNSAEEAKKAAQDEWSKLKKIYPNRYFIVGQPVAYAKGGLANFTGPAWLDGTPSAPERILSPKQTKLFKSMVSSLEKASSNSVSYGSTFGYNVGDIITTIQVDKLDNQTDINRLAKLVEDKIVKDIRNKVSVSVSKGV